MKCCKHWFTQALWAHSLFLDRFFLALFFSDTHIRHTLTQVYNIRPYQKQGDYFLSLTWVIHSLSCIPVTSRTDQLLFHPLRLSWDHLILYKKKLSPSNHALVHTLTSLTWAYLLIIEWFQCCFSLKTTIILYLFLSVSLDRYHLQIIW